MRYTRTVAILHFSLLLVPVALTAQREPERQLRRGSAALTFETLGGIAGSLVGVGGGLLIAKAGNECGNEDLACGLEQAATTGLVSIVGATAGTYLAGRAANTEPSVLGAFLGSIAGVAAGVGVIHLLTEESKVASNNATLVAAYSITQGLVAAIGSRLVAAVR
jgi:uncharacterized membrane protein YfcA